MSASSKSRPSKAGGPELSRCACPVGLPLGPVGDAAQTWVGRV